MNTLRLLGAAAVVAALAACAGPHPSASVYQPRHTMNEHTIRMGAVESVRDVTLSGHDTGIGSMAGAVIGSSVMSNVGRGSGSFVASIVGAIAGGMIGQRAEAGAASRPGVEITVRLDNGELRAVTQLADELFQPGERVRLHSSSNGTRVTH